MSFYYKCDYLIIQIFNLTLKWAFVEEWPYTWQDLFRLHWFTKENTAFSRMNQKSHIYSKEENSSEVFLTFDDPSITSMCQLADKATSRQTVLPDIPGAVILHSAWAIRQLLWNNCALFIRCLLGNNTTMSEFSLNYLQIKLKYWCLSISFFAPLSAILSREQCTLYFFNRQLLYQ